MTGKRNRNPLAPAPHKERLPDEEVKRRYPWFRWRIMEATFIGYASFYLVRNNLSVVAKDIEGALGYSHDNIGTILAVLAISYGIGKFVLGSLSDRSDVRKFMALGLFLTAVCNFAFGSASTFWVHVVLWGLNGLVQGMGWPPCGRSMGHWYSEKERGLKFSMWNTSHNLGGGIAGIIAAWAAMTYGGWQYAFYVPGALALIGSVYLFIRLVDTPQSCGLPPVEEYMNDYTEDDKAHGTMERNLTTKELFVDFVFKNKIIWLLAFANFFVYITRYSMLDWGPMYLREMKGASMMEGGWGVFIIEFAGIPSTVFLGWISDLWGGRRGMVSALCMIPVLGAFLVMLLVPGSMVGLIMVMQGIIGFFVYPVINLITIQALDLTSKKAIGTVAGFIGLFGYIGRMVMNKGFGWTLDRFTVSHNEQFAWNIVLAAIVLSAFLGGVLLAFTWRLKPGDRMSRAK